MPWYFFRFEYPTGIHIDRSINRLSVDRDMEEWLTNETGPGRHIDFGTCGLNDIYYHPPTDNLNWYWTVVCEKDDFHIVFLMKSKETATLFKLTWNGEAITD